MSKEIERQYKIEKMMADEDILLAYRDVITEETVQWLLELTELRLTMHGSGKKIRKRVFNIMVECLQNIVKHADHSNGNMASILLVSREEDAFCVRSGNMVLNEDVAEFEKRMESVNALAHSELRVAYNDQLEDSDFSEKGGAGLGLLDMYRRSGNPISYFIRPMDDVRSFLSLHIRVANAED